MFSSVVSFTVYAEDVDKTLIKDTGQRSDWQSKLYPESFIGEYEQALDNDIFTVWAWVKDKTEEYDVARMVYEETGLNAGNITSVSEEEYQAELETWTEEDEKLLSKEAPEYSKRAMLESRIQQRKTAEYISALRRIEKEITSISNNDILKTLDLKEDEILYVSTDAPVMALKLSKSEIGRIAQYKDVNSIEHVGSLSDIKQYGSDPSEKDTYTYYFLAPEFWIDTAQGAENENVGVFYWEPEEAADFPGVIMTPAPEIGEKIFKAEVPKETATIIFNDGYSYETSDPRYKNTITESQIVSCEGYEYDCPYDINLNCDNFDGWIFVLNFDQTTEHQMVKMKCNGAWFKLDDYKNYDEYYGSYPERKDSSEDAHAIGDIDGDGTVTSNDALDVLRISVNPNSANDETRKLADVDGDTEITANDALAVLRYSVGLADENSPINKPIAA